MQLQMGRGKSLYVRIPTQYQYKLDENMDVPYLICVNRDFRRYTPSGLVNTNRIWHFYLYYNYYMYLRHAGLPFTLMLLHFSTLANNNLYYVHVVVYYTIRIGLSPN